MNTERRYDIDWLRVIAIGLLLIYHIAIVFQPWAMLIGFIRSEEFMENLWKPMTMLNVWRIPILFYVSGMGVYFAMRKRSAKQLVLERGKRILVPYLFGIIAIVPLHFFIFQYFYGQELIYFPHPAHLWFLGNIAIYISILFPLFYYLKARPKSRFRQLSIRIMSHPLGPVSVVIFFIVEVLVVKPPIFSLYAQTFHGYAIGFLAFFFGFLFVYVGEVFWNTVLKWKWLYLGIALSLFIVRLSVYNSTSPNYLMSIESNLWILGIFGVCYKYLNKPSFMLSYLSKAAYPVYIIHMFVLYAAASFILPLGIPISVKFILIVLFTFLGCFAMYDLLIKRFSLLRIPFGLQQTIKKSNQSAEEKAIPAS